MKSWIFLLLLLMPACLRFTPKHNWVVAENKDGITKCWYLYRTEIYSEKSGIFWYHKGQKIQVSGNYNYIRIDEANMDQDLDRAQEILQIDLKTCKPGSPILP